MAANLKYLTLVFFLQALFTVISIPPTHCSRSLKTNSSNDEKLIEKTCNRTSNYDLCLQYLRADPSSYDSDVKGLAVIMLKVMKAKAEATEDKIQELLHGKEKGIPITEKQEKALKTCDGSCYVSILHNYIPDAIEALRNADVDLACKLIASAADGAMFCERAFSPEPSLLTQQNNDMHDVSIIAASIVAQL